MTTLRKNTGLIAALIKIVALVASVCGVVFLFKDSIEDILSTVRGKDSNDDFEPFDEDEDFDTEEIFNKKSNREYVDIKITDDEELEDDSKEAAEDENSDDKESKIADDKDEADE